MDSVVLPIIFSAQSLIPLRWIRASSLSEKIIESYILYWVEWYGK